MKLVCPKCARPLAVVDSLVPAAGGWARCPRCGERFFLRPPGSDLSSSPVPPAPTITRKGEARRELLRRLNARNNAPLRPEPPSAYEEEVTIFPRRAWSKEASLAAGCLILALVLVSVLLVFRASVHRPSAPPAPSPVPARLNDDQGEALVRQDLAELLRRNAGRQYLWTVVDYSGPESRIFRFFRARLVPKEDCPGLSRLELKSAAPGEGLSFWGTCLNQADQVLDEPLELKLRWAGGSVKAAFTDYPGEAELELYTSGRP